MGTARTGLALSSDRNRWGAGGLKESPLQVQLVLLLRDVRQDGSENRGRHEPL